MSKISFHDTRPLFESSKKRPVSIMNIEATVENNPQLLRKLRSYEAACLRIPGTLSDAGQHVMKLLFDCFDKNKVVQEGLIGDLLWGFSQCGTPAELSVHGLMNLSVHGYVKFRAQDSTYTDFMHDAIGSAFVEYQPKLLEMVYVSDSPEQ